MFFSLHNNALGVDVLLLDFNSNQPHLHLRELSRAEGCTEGISTLQICLSICSTGAACLSCRSTDSGALSLCSATPAEPWGPSKHRFPAFWSCFHFVFLKSMSVGSNVNAVTGNLKPPAPVCCQFHLCCFVAVCRTFLWPRKHRLAAQTP